MPRKISAIMPMIKQMIETRTWKKVRALTENSLCRLCVCVCLCVFVCVCVCECVCVYFLSP